MRFPIFRLTVLALAALICPRRVLSASAPLVPLRAFFDYPTVAEPRISPDGTKIAFIAPYKGHMAVALYPVGSAGAEIAEAPTDGNVNFLLWKDNDHLIYAGASDDSEYSALSCLNFARHNVTQLVHGAWTFVAGAVDPLYDDPEHIALIGLSYDGDGRSALININNGAADYLYPADRDINHPDRMIMDNTGLVRLISRLSNDPKQGRLETWYYRPSPNVAYTEIKQFHVFHSKWEPQFFAPDNHTVYLVSYEKADTGELRTYDCDTRRLGPVLFHDPQGEIDYAISDTHAHLLGVAYLTDREQVRWFDPHFRAVQAGIDHALPATLNSIVDFDAAKRRFIIASASDRQPAVFYLLDTEKHTLTPIGQTRPLIRARDMCPMQPVSFTARDGVLIHGYLTRPLGAGDKSGPLVLLPHGGPQARDLWGFDPEVQFLANRGYSVLQVNFRGSTGYGLAFAALGEGQWGRKMQDDLTDAVKWAVAQGWADPKRICIYGASYGGYAALMGLELTPELYKCGVNYAGVTDLANMAADKYARTPFSRAVAQFYFGGGSATLGRYSPVNFVQNIRVPTLHAYGGNDPRVDIHQWRELRRQLERYHKPFTYIELPYEGHGFREEEDRLKFYAALEQFLNANL